MPKHLEKKYRVESFDEIKAKLLKVKAEIQPASTTLHYYADQQTDNITKLVVYPDKSEIHILKANNGAFSLTDKITVYSEEDGLEWLKKRGFKGTKLVKMTNLDCQYNGGIVGLYIINDKLLSVILDFPLDQQEGMAELFGMKDKEIINQPYNKYLETEE